MKKKEERQCIVPQMFVKHPKSLADICNKYGKGYQWDGYY